MKEDISEFLEELNDAQPLLSKEHLHWFLLWRRLKYLHRSVQDVELLLEGVKDRI